jgi:hypothetical protein
LKKSSVVGAPTHPKFLDFSQFDLYFYLEKSSIPGLSVKHYIDECLAFFDHLFPLKFPTL